MAALADLVVGGERILAYRLGYENASRADVPFIKKHPDDSMQMQGAIDLNSGGVSVL